MNDKLYPVLKRSGVRPFTTADECAEWFKSARPVASHSIVERDDKGKLRAVTVGRYALLCLCAAHGIEAPR